MKASEYVKGMRVRIADDISKTNRRYSINTTMRNMRGKVFILSGITNLKKGGFVYHNDYRYTFALDDLIVANEKPKVPKSVLFDPKYLDV